MVDILSNCSQVRETVRTLQRRGRTVGLVPTMGALHAGHQSLIQASASECDCTVVSIFVNPTQFGPGEDLDRYPRTLDEDLAKIESAGGDFAFVPSVDQMYPEGFSTSIVPPEVGHTLEGECRPGHFAGVATVVLKLFHAVPADRAFFGRKDYQQLKVIEAMVRDLNLPIEIVARRTVREEDGLALSSRNRYLSAENRVRALSLSRALAKAENAVASGQRNVHQIESEMREPLADVDQIDYACVVDAETLEPIAHLNRDAIALIAASVGGTRLIDNALLSIASAEIDASGPGKIG